MKMKKIVLALLLISTPAIADDQSAIKALYRLKIGLENGVTQRQLDALNQDAELEMEMSSNPEIKDCYKKVAVWALYVELTHKLGERQGSDQYLKAKQCLEELKK